MDKFLVKLLIDKNWNKALRICGEINGLDVSSCLTNIFQLSPFKVFNLPLIASLAPLEIKNNF
jgi:hypothetical protein